MIIIRLFERLGNQMFHFALYKAFEKRGYETYIDDSDIFENKYKNIDKYFDVFDVKYKRATTQSINKLKKFPKDMNYWELTVRRVKRELKIPLKHYHEKAAFEYDEKIFLLSKDHYIDGFWQNYNYYNGLEDILRKEFDLSNKLNEENKKVNELIGRNNSVSIHIRRTDYISSNLHKDIANDDFYKKAIKIINEKIQSPIFFVFSDDIQHCKSMFSEEGFYYVDINNERSNYLDLYLMSNCKNNIIANSSFSWWAAWLNSNKEKTVIAPRKWINDNKINSTDVCPPEWIRI